jgi:hypothetical protein
MPHSFRSGAANSGRSRLLSRLSPTCESLFQPEKPPKQNCLPTTKAEGWTEENYAALAILPAAAF